jgi:hypothetical protein
MILEKTCEDEIGSTVVKTHDLMGIRKVKSENDKGAHQEFRE